MTREKSPSSLCQSVWDGSQSPESALTLLEVLSPVLKSVSFSCTWTGRLLNKKGPWQPKTACRSPFGNTRNGWWWSGWCCTMRSLDGGSCCRLQRVHKLVADPLQRMCCSVFSVWRFYFGDKGSSELIKTITFTALKLFYVEDTADCEVILCCTYLVSGSVVWMYTLNEKSKWKVSTQTQTKYFLCGCIHL